MTTSTEAGPYADLIIWLTDHEVPFELHDHPVTYTAAATAHAEGVSERTFAKVVGLRDSRGERLLAAVDAADQVDLVRLALHLGVDWVSPLTEHELKELLPACEPGTIPPIPELARVPVIADRSLRDAAEISFHAGSHATTVRVYRPAWEWAAGIRYGEFATARVAP